MKTYFAAAIIVALSVGGVNASDLNVFAAASLKGALDEIAAHYTADHIVLTYAASGTLAKQIEASAPADIFISADEEWMDLLAANNLIRTETRADVVGNVLVLIKNKQDASEIKLDTFATTLGEDKLALADVTSVPAGGYAKAALENLGQWARVSKNVVMQDNVRGALSLVARGEAKLGVVYGSDAVVEPKVEVVALFPESTHAAIRYPAAVVANSQNTSAKDFVGYLLGSQAQTIFSAYGFKTLP